MLVVTPRLPSDVTSSLSSTDWLDLTDTQIEHRPEFILFNNNYPMPTSLTLIHTADLERIPRVDGMRVYKAFYSADCSMAINCIPDVERTYILRRVVVRPRQAGGANRATTTTKPSSNLPDFIEKHLEWKIHSVGVYDVFVIKMKNDTDLWKRAVQSEDVFDVGFGVSYNLYK